MRSRASLLLTVAAAASASLLPSAAEAGGAILPPANKRQPGLLDVRMAVAPSPRGATRWTEITYAARARVMWLVPARPGAAISWTHDAWLDALDDATAIRVLPPESPAACALPSSAARAGSWATKGVRGARTEATLLATEADVRRHSAARGFAIPAAIDARLASLQAEGWSLVAVEIDPALGATTAGTMRVSDDGPAMIPLALTGSDQAATRVTVFAVGGGVAALQGARDVDPARINWYADGSNYDAWRRVTIGSDASWIRESATHAALFDGVDIGGTIPLPSVTAGYFPAVGGQAHPMCTVAAQSAASSGGPVDPAALSCGAHGDDLALALSATSPRTAVVTRFAGIVPNGALGADLPVIFEAETPERSPAVTAARGVCARAPKAPPEAPPSTATPAPPPVVSGGRGDRAGAGSGSASAGANGTRYVTRHDGCGGSTTTSSDDVVYDDGAVEDSSSTTESCGGATVSDPDTDDWDSDDASSGSSSDACASDGSGWDDGDDGDGWDSDDGDDGWDSEEMTPSHHGSNKKTAHARANVKKKPASPVSRYALLAAALLLPLRRRTRGAP